MELILIIFGFCIGFALAIIFLAHTMSETDAKRVKAGVMQVDGKGYRIVPLEPLEGR